MTARRGKQTKGDIMTDYRYIIAKNLISLRVSAKLTQAEVAARLSYSDKAVSKWERAESIPDVAVLKTIADMYGVTVDYLLEEHDKTELPETEKPRRRMTRNQTLITLISLLGIWFIAVSSFAACYAYGIVAWQLFVWAAPVSAVVALVLCCVWSGRLWCFTCTSLVIWTIAMALFVTIMKQRSIWLVFVAAAILELTTLLGFGIHPAKKYRDKLPKKKKKDKDKDADADGGDGSAEAPHE